VRKLFQNSYLVLYKRKKKSHTDLVKHESDIILGELFLYTQQTLKKPLRARGLTDANARFICNSFFSFFWK